MLRQTTQLKTELQVFNKFLYRFSLPIIYVPLVIANSGEQLERASD